METIVIVALTAFNCFLGLIVLGLTALNFKLYTEYFKDKSASRRRD